VAVLTESLCKVVGLLSINGSRGDGDRLRSGGFLSDFSGSGAMGSKSHGDCGVGDGGVSASVLVIVVLWELVLVIAYYMRWDYYIVSTVYIHFFTSFYAFFLHVMYSSSKFSKISGISLRFLEFRGIFSVLRAY
jgi:hypothetical protein